MKRFKQLKKKMRDGDKEFIAAHLKISPSLVRMVVNDKRTDHYKILEAFNILIRFREQFTRHAITRIRLLRAK